MYIPVHCYLRVCSANTLLIRTTDIRVASEIRRGLFFVKRQRRCPPLTSAFAKRRYRYKAQAKINRRPVEKRTSVYTFQRQVFLVKNLLLFRNTAIRGGTDTLRIFSSGKDATDLNRSNEVDAPPLTSALTNSLLTSVLPCTLVNDEIYA